jgi:hypothetical protein
MSDTVRANRARRRNWQENEGRRIGRTAHSSALILLPTDLIAVRFNRVWPVVGLLLACCWPVGARFACWGHSLFLVDRGGLDRAVADYSQAIRLDCVAFEHAVAISPKPSGAYNLGALFYYRGKVYLKTPRQVGVGLRRGQSPRIRALVSGMFSTRLSRTDEQ